MVLELIAGNVSFKGVVIVRKQLARRTESLDNNTISRNHDRI